MCLPFGIQPTSGNTARKPRSSMTSTEHYHCIVLLNLITDMIILILITNAAIQNHIYIRCHHSVRGMSTPSHTHSHTPTIADTLIRHHTSPTHTHTSSHNSHTLSHNTYTHTTLNMYISTRVHTNRQTDRETYACIERHTHTITHNNHTITHREV